VLKYIDFFDLINQDKEPPVAALFMSYGFDAELFEQHLLPGFLGIPGNPEENELRFRKELALKLREVPVTVLSDGRQYNGGRTFLYDHITIWEYTFHPKCYILLYQTYILVIIGSCNLTKAGLCYNAETLWYEDITQDQPSGLAEQLKGILSWLREHYGLDGNYALKEISKFLGGCRGGKGFPKLLSTVSTASVFDNLLAEIKDLQEECRSLSILSPFFENDRDRAMEKTLLMQFAAAVKNAYPKAKFKIYFPALKSQQEKQYKVTAPVNIFGELCSQYKDTELYVIHRGWEREDGEPVPRTLHAKIILVELKGGKKLLLSGSINFTNNAMRSKMGSLRNIELGVLEYGSLKFALPGSTKVGVKDLFYEDREVREKGIVPFVESADLDEKRLVIKLMKEPQIVPFRIEYQNQLLYETEQGLDHIIIEGFRLKRSQDLHIFCSDFDFYVPIRIVNKEEFESEDLKLSFELEMKDIIDYLVGKYKSLSEIERLKRVQRLQEKEAAGGLALYFRHNLQRYYKAMAALKQGLELPYYSELAFTSYLTNSMGLKNLLQLIVKDFKQGTAAKEETFLLLVELENVIAHLQYPEDPLGRAFKEQELAQLMTEAVAIRRGIYKTAGKTLRNQYDVLLNAYRLEREEHVYKGNDKAI